MKLLLAALALAIGLPASSLRAEEAVAILDRVLAHRPTKDLALKARLFLTRERFVPVEILIQHRTADTRTLYRGAQTELLVVQPLTAEPRYYLKGAGELTGARRLEKLLGSQFVFYDLGLPFLHWPGPKLVGEERTRGRDCFRIECQAAGQPYARVKLWIDKEYGALLSAEAFNADDRLVRRFSVTSFKRVGEVWIPRGLESGFVLPGQALPAEDRSRLEISEGNYDAQLPAELFDPARFASPAGSATARP
jgi:hypothetical protein